MSKKRLLPTLFFAILCIAGCAANNATSVPDSAQLPPQTTLSSVRSAGASPAPRVWLMNGPYIEAWDMATNDGNTPGVTNIGYFSNTNHIVLYPADAAVTPPPTSWNVRYWMKFNDLVAFENALNTPGAIPSEVTVVAYDNEKWTPCQQWQSPCNGKPDPATIISSMKTFASLAVGSPQKYSVMFTPAFDLFSSENGNKYTNFINSGIVAAVAGVADYYHIQVQGLEADPSTYVSVVTSIASTLHGINPGVVVTAGLSNYDPASETSFTYQQIVTAVKQSSTLVSGYWPNVVNPSPGSSPEPNPGNPVFDAAINSLSSISPHP